MVSDGAQSAVNAKAGTSALESSGRARRSTLTALLAPASSTDTANATRRTEILRWRRRHRDLWPAHLASNRSQIRPASFLAASVTISNRKEAILVELVRGEARRAGPARSLIHLRDNVLRGMVARGV